MIDLIDRQDVIRVLQSMMQDCFPEAEEELDAVVTTVREIPSAEPERKWIPVTEALPEKHQRVLVTIKRIDGEMRVRSGNYFDDYFWIDNGDYWKCNEVLAWMPLPEAYRGE